MFQLTNQQTKINSFTPRMEKHGFSFEPLDGGSCAIKFALNFTQDGRTSGKLCQLIQDTVEVTLTPPSKDDAQQDLAA